MNVSIRRDVLAKCTRGESSCHGVGVFLVSKHFSFASVGCATYGPYRNAFAPYA